MNLNLRARWYWSVLACVGALVVGVSAADVHVMISAGFHGTYADLLPVFERETGHRVTTTRGPSMGDSPEALPTRLARGEPADVVILDGGAADELIEHGHAVPGSKILLAHSRIGMVVRAGALVPRIATVDEFKQALVAAKSIAYSDSGSGTYLSTTLFKQLGLEDQIAKKSRKVRGPPSGEPVAAVVARGEVEIGFQQISELMHVEGTTLVGPIPTELQPGATFAGVITTHAAQAEAGRELLRFLRSPRAAEAMSRRGLTPP